MDQHLIIHNIDTLDCRSEIPTVSVIIPTYNRAEFLLRSVKSVLEQKFDDFELIIVDDASSDNTRDIVKNIGDERIRYIRHEKNRGAAAARNTGIMVARGEYVAFQDSDDEWLPEKLEKQIGVILTASPDVGVVYTDMRRIGTNGTNEYWHSPEITDGRLINENKTSYQVYKLGIQSTLIRKECFDTVGFFDERFPRLIDLELFIRLSKESSFCHIKEPLVKYYKTEGISSNTISLIRAEKLLLEKYAEELKINRVFLRRRYRKIALILCSIGQMEEGRAYFIKATVLCPFDIKNILCLVFSLLGFSIFNKVLAIYGNWCVFRRKPLTESE